MLIPYGLINIYLMFIPHLFHGYLMSYLVNIMILTCPTCMPSANAINASLSGSLIRAEVESPPDTPECGGNPAPTDCVKGWRLHNFLRRHTTTKHTPKSINITPAAVAIDTNNVPLGVIYSSKKTTKNALKIPKNYNSLTHINFIDEKSKSSVEFY